MHAGIQVYGEEYGLRAYTRPRMRAFDVMIRLARWNTYNKMYVTGRRNVIEKRKDGVSACFSLITPILYLSTFFENSTFSSVTTIEVNPLRPPPAPLPSVSFYID